MYRPGREATEGWSTTVCEMCKQPLAKQRSGAQSSAPALRELRTVAPGIKQVGADGEIRGDFRDGFAGRQQAEGLLFELSGVALIGLFTHGSG